MVIYQHAFGKVALSLIFFYLAKYQTVIVSFDQNSSKTHLINYIASDMRNFILIFCFPFSENFMISVVCVHHQIMATTSYYKQFSFT